MWLTRKKKKKCQGSPVTLSGVAVSWRHLRCDQYIIREGVEGFKRVPRPKEIPEGAVNRRKLRFISGFFIWFFIGFVGGRGGVVRQRTGRRRVKGGEGDSLGLT